MKSNGDGQSFFETEKDMLFLETLIRFAKEIRFTDTPIIVLFVFHIIMFATLIITRRHLIISTILFFFNVFLLYITPNVNSYFTENWSRIGFTTNYFDQTYVDIFVIWTLPIVIECSVILLILAVDILLQYFRGRKAIAHKN